MPLEPKVRDFPRIRGALKFFIFAANVTGVLLLLVLIEMVLKYAFGREIEMGGPQGFLAVAPIDTITAINVSTGILIVHGWFYVVYLFACFRLWSFMRWPFPSLLILASGGIVPGLSFVWEAQYSRKVHRYLDQREAQEALA